VGDDGGLEGGQPGEPLLLLVVVAQVHPLVLVRRCPRKNEERRTKKSVNAGRATQDFFFEV
jgi:hypothetical protein